MPKSFTFSREGEPPNLDTYYEKLQDAQLVEAFAPVVVGMVQTADYARAMLEQSGYPRRVAQVRALNRVERGRLLTSAGALGRIVMPAVALHDVSSVGGNFDILREQLDYLIYLTEQGMQAGSVSPKIGILSTEALARVGVSRSFGQNVTSIDTEKDRFLVGIDGFDVIPASTQDPLAAEVVRFRERLLADVLGQAVFGEEARSAIVGHYNALGGA